MPVRVAYPVLDNELERQLFISVIFLLVLVILLVGFNFKYAIFTFVSLVLVLIASIIFYRSQRQFKVFDLVYQKAGWSIEYKDWVTEPLIVQRLAVIFALETVILLKLQLCYDEKIIFRWCWLQQKTAPHLWHDLRCALFNN